MSGKNSPVRQMEGKFITKAKRFMMRGGILKKYLTIEEIRNSERRKQMDHKTSLVDDIEEMFQSSENGLCL